MPFAVSFNNIGDLADSKADLMCVQCPVVDGSGIDRAHALWLTHSSCVAQQGEYCFSNVYSVISFVTE